MSQRSTIIYTTGAAGTGKTYVRCPRFIVDDFLPNRRGVHWSNFPLGVVPEHAGPQSEGETYRDRIAAEMVRRRGGEANDWRDRVEMIPPEEIERWRTGESGPWSFFADADLGGAHIAIDEIHVFCGRNTQAKIRKQWQDWLGEIRHRGATVEFLSQSPNKVAKEISWEAGTRYQLVAGDERRSPVLKIQMGDYYELRAAWLTREYRTPMFLVEQRQLFGHFRKSADTRIDRDPAYFRLYDSFSTPHGGGRAAPSELREFEKRTRIGLTIWFAARNAFPLFKGFAMIAGIAFLMSGLASTMLISGVTWATQQAGFGTPVVASVAADTSPEIELGAAEPLATPAAKAIPQTAVKVAPPAAEQRATRARDADGLTQLESEQGATIETLRAELAAALAERDELGARVEQLEDERRRASALLLVSPRGITLRNGMDYEVGELIDYGVYDGHVVESVDLRRRIARLSDGVVLRLGLHDAPE